MPDSSLRSDIEDTFRGLREQYGLPDDGENLPDEAEEFVPPVALPVEPEPEPEDPDVEEFFPGSNRRISEDIPKAPEAPAASDDWREFTHAEEIDGREVTLYPIRALAVALHRAPATIRKWEGKGWLPAPPYRARGDRGDRLYTAKHIEGLVMIAREEGLLGPLKKPRLDQTRFPTRAHRLFTALLARRA